MQLNIASQAARTHATRACVAACYVLTLLVLLPLLPGMPAATSDASWHYALNVAVANHLRFGHDLVFAFGPLASAFTLQYFPGTDALMLATSWVLATAVFLGFAVLALPGGAFWLLAVPLVVSQLATRDALFMVLPLMLLLAAEKDPSQRWHRFGVFFIGAACALLPLVQGSLTPVVLLCSLLAALALWQRSPRDAVLLLALQLLAMCGAWVLAGQSWPDLPRYFAAQLPIVLGYTEAMALAGSQEPVFAYLAAASVLVFATTRSEAPVQWRVLLANVAVLFLCMKAAFVRHDIHGLIAGGALLLVGVLVVFRHLSAVGVAALGVALAGWAFIVDPYETIEPRARLARFTGSLHRSLEGLEVRVLHPGRLDDWFRAANEGIARGEPLPHTPATMAADLYPSNLAVLLANGGQWRPRPVLQNYSAYTPALAALNQSHLQWNGPDRIYFGFDPIDRRYPSLDDGSSWPVLLARYEPAGLAGSYAVLDRRRTPAKVEVGTPFFDGEKVVGGAVAIPGGSPVWAHIDLAPTLLGRVASFVFKLPQLSLVVRYADGTRKVYRFVPAMARSGFLLSPTVATPADFIALQSPNAQEVLAPKVPVSFALRGASGTSVLWNRTFTLKLAPLHIDPATAPADPAMGPQAAATVATRAVLARP